MFSDPQAKDLGNIIGSSLFPISHIQLVSPVDVTCKNMLHWTTAYSLTDPTLLLSTLSQLDHGGNLGSPVPLWTLRLIPTWSQRESANTWVKSGPSLPRACLWLHLTHSVSTDQWINKPNDDIYAEVKSILKKKRNTEWICITLINSPSQASALREPWTSRCSSWF